MARGRWLQDRIYSRRLKPVLWLFAPLALIFFLLAALRRQAYRYSWRQSSALPVPVVVVGNLTVGGSGKTPLVLWLSRQLVAAGLKPGIVSRGYGGSCRSPSPVCMDSMPDQVGDEPLLLAWNSGVPVWVGRDRVAVGQALLEAHPEVNVLLCDDGLQHYRLQRDFEFVVFDGRGVGNGWPLPMGPLREPLSRLKQVQALVFNGAPDHRVLKAAPHVRHFAMRLEPMAFYRLGQVGCRCSAADLKGRKLHAVVGIGDPGRFFRTLAELGLDFERHPFPDHHAYQPEELAFPEGEVILMTEKDSVKCTGFELGEVWVLPVEAQLPPELMDILLEALNEHKAA